MLDATIQGKLARFVKPGPCDPELDRFAAFVQRGAVISGARWYCVKAEDREIEMEFKPEGGLTDDHYRRLGTAPLERVQLARAVIENLLKRRGHGLPAIVEAFRGVNDETLPGLVKEYSFEAMADALEPCPSGRPHLFGGRVPPDDGTIHVFIGEERPWQGSVVRPQSGRR